ncbi:glycosyltransferase family 1 protein [Methylomonas sp. EbA]|uniref:Glycosyltransferase family 1 protein n=1 Tax=Methylomonas albis TaxID=1854563 RepID=A0ABR9CX27_9GAMM|nr:glycosyltransferase family 1 protein [Methylomonas albis]
MIDPDALVTLVLADIFFLDIQDAYAEAAKQQWLRDANGVERLQYCYYDGLLTDIALPNFIQVPADKFVEFFSHNHLPIPRLIGISQDDEVRLNDMPADVIDEVLAYRHQYRVPEYVHFDTYFVDPLLALNVAKQGNRINCGHPTIDGLQICYYRGELPEHSLENLVHLELPDYEEFFIRSLLRMPENIEIPEDLDAEVKAAVRQDIAAATESIKRRRLWLVQRLLHKAKLQKPRLYQNQAPRIFIPTSRLTTVMQYSSQGIAKAFAALGWEVMFYLQSNDMECGNMVSMLEKYINFDPQACFYVNSLQNSFMHDDIVNVIWWQDLMPQLKAGQTLNWRTRDFNFSISPLFDRYLAQVNATRVERLHFVIDDEVFNLTNVGIRTDKIVFIGSSYLPVVNRENQQHQQAVSELAALMASGDCFDEATVNHVAEAAGLSYEFVFWKLLHYVIRDHAVQWLCDTPDLPVEVYGRYWDQDSAVAPYYLGELTHGQAVADVYRGARYALVCHPFEINSQRLAEVAACGCIPVVYDCRDVAEPPHWDEYCLFFKTVQELRHILAHRLQPAKAPEGLADRFTYRAAAQRVITLTDLSTLSIDPDAHISASIPVLQELCGAKLRLMTGDLALRQRCAANIQTNLACLARYRPELKDGLLAAWKQQQLTVILDRMIGEECWQVAVELDGAEIYRLDNVALLEHKRLIENNATQMTRENTCCYALVGLGSGYELFAVFNATTLPITEMAEFEVPIYLIESMPEVWLLNLLLHDLSGLIGARRLQIFHGGDSERELAREFARFEAALPDVLFELNPQPSVNAASLYQLTLDAKESRSQRHLANLKAVADYYEGITPEQWRHKFSQECVEPLRVMGFISRFSSFLKYCMRDWLDGFERLGASINLLSESENYYLTNVEHLIAEINQFRPDIILTIDHFRHEYECMPKEVPFVNWIQDMLPNITGNQTVLTSRDFTFVFSKHWMAMNENELYQDVPFEHLPVGFNDKYYYPLSRNDYDYDFLVISHLIEPGKTFQPFRLSEEFGWQYDDNERLLLQNGYLTAQQIYEIYKILVNYIDSLAVNQFHEFCIDNQGGNFYLMWQLLKDHGLDIDKMLINKLMAGASTRFHADYLMGMKTRPIQALVQSDLELRLAIYGRNWEKYPTFSSYAKGVADNGERINQLMSRSKICFNGSPGTTLHMRALEIMASGAFMLSKRIYNDAAPLSEYYSEDEVVYYEDETDLVEKVRFYLNHEHIRVSKAEKAYLKTLELFSYEAIAGRVLNSLVSRLDGCLQK